MTPSNREKEAEELLEDVKRILDDASTVLVMSGRSEFAMDVRLAAQAIHRHQRKYSRRGKVGVE